MNKIDELLQLLDDLGVEYQHKDNTHGIPSYERVEWYYGEYNMAWYYVYHDGSTRFLATIDVTNISPKQAAETTLRLGELAKCLEQEIDRTTNG